MKLRKIRPEWQIKLGFSYFKISINKRKRKLSNRVRIDMGHPLSMLTVVISIRKTVKIHFLQRFEYPISHAKVINIAQPLPYF